MSYYVNKIENNTYNQYKYHYLDHMCSIINMRSNIWSFAIDLYSINNFNIPPNSLVGDLQMPYQQIQNISFNLATDQSYAKTMVEHNINYAHLYTSDFNVDISQNEFFKQDLNNSLINFDLNLFIDPDAAKAAGSEISQDVLDTLINDTREQRWNFKMYYSNTYSLKHNGIVNDIVGYELPFGHQFIPIVKQIDCCSDELLNIQKPINKLFILKSATPFQVLSAKVKFNYWIELEAQWKTLEKILNIDKTFQNEIELFFDEYTLFDYDKKEVVINSIGAKGFYIPKFSQGYYVVELLIEQNSIQNKLILLNQFNFIKNHDKPYVAISHKLINNIDDFKEVIC